MSRDAEIPTIGWRAPDPPLPVVSFVDLDDTLFSSPARGGYGQPVTVTRDGRPYSYMSPAQQQLFALLRAAGRVIPTTARVPEQLDRVRLPFDDYAICANGAIIIDPDGGRDLAWQAEVDDRLAEVTVDTPELMRLAADIPGGDGLRIESVPVDGQALMVDVRDPSRAIPPMTRWAEAMRPHMPADWVLDLSQDRALLHPRGVDKAAAVRWFVEHRVEQPALILGAGDRRSDHHFIARTDFAIVPTGSPLFDGIAP